MVNNKQKFDVVIAGGGLSGCLSALALSALKTSSGKPLSIAIIEASDVSPNKANLSETPHFDSRVLALSHGSANYLSQLNVWPKIAAQAAAIETIHISDRGHYGKARIYANEHHVDALGYVIEMATLGDALVQALANKTNICWFSSTSVKAINWHPTEVSITLANEHELSASLLLACDGGQSICRKFAEIDANVKQYNQSAVIANVRFSKPHQHVAYERFTEHGPIAMLPLVEQATDSHKCSLVWTTTPDNAQNLQKLSEQDFAQQLNDAFGYWLGNVEYVGQRVSYPLSLVKAQEQVFHRMILVGNASHTIHPIAGQGFNLGLRDVSELAEMIKLQLMQEDDIANFSQLTRYAKQRSYDHQQVINLTDSLVTFFSNTHAPLVVGRNIGVKVLNYCQSLKNIFVNKTMGY
ncbi:2-octaprenyl-6-methoxyphenyl hydroxylase [Thalassotalea sediminis]|uniref:2-octaprenyl-6-methoxyphenyl hydroxylase n=1 Tax=Thalassotalea sediminis TaxID=1759089 RepID=UPI00257314CC|nr:2-octaprenyl-6-methoxyphenyl hydroxylase [Thalassotalea sediminis]